jgi:hypothetical protein
MVRKDKMVKNGHFGVFDGKDGRSIIYEKFTFSFSLTIE